MMDMAHIPSPRPENPSDRAWKFLARLAKERRDFIGLSQEELAQFGGPRKSTVGKIENARQRSFPPRTQQQLEKALGWPRGSIRDILGAPDEEGFETHEDTIAADYIEAELPDLTSSGSSASAVSNASGLSDDELLSELTFRMKKYGQAALDAGATITASGSVASVTPIQRSGPDESITGPDPAFDVAADTTGRASMKEDRTCR